MSPRRGATDLDRLSVAWSGPKQWLVLGASAFFLLALVAGLVLAVISWVSPGAPIDAARASRPVASTPPVTIATDSPGTALSEQGQRDELASRPMPTAEPGDEKPAPQSTRVPAEPITLPAGTRVGERSVVTGFPHTPQGAVAQLAAIDQAGFATGSMDGIRAVIGPWAAPGGPTAATWSGVMGMRTLLDSAGLPATGSSLLTLQLTPAMAQIKGSVGPDFTVVCVDFTLQATYNAKTIQVGVADCQRMVWSGGRWVLGPGAEPFQTTSVWPDTDAAIDAGWRDVAIDALNTGH